MPNGDLRINELQHLAQTIGVPLSTLEAIAANLRAHVRRKTKLVKDKERLLTEPRWRLKQVQRLIAATLLADVPVSAAAHGYRKGRSNVTAAGEHVGAPWLLHMDIKGFFPHVRYSRIYNIWRDLGCAPDVARILTRLTTFDGYLPLGFPTSPALANIVCRRIDARIEGLSRRLGYVYTRYSDNILISGSRITPETAERFRRIIEEDGLPLPRKRVQLLGPGDARKALGLTIGRKVNITREHRRRVRAEIHRHVVSPSRSATTRAEELSLQGKVAYVSRISPGHGRNLRALLHRKHSAAPLIAEQSAAAPTSSPS